MLYGFVSQSLFSLCSSPGSWQLKLRYECTKHCSFSGCFYLLPGFHFQFMPKGTFKLCCFYPATPRLSHLSIGGRNYRENSISYLPLDDMRFWGDRRLPTLSFRCLSSTCAFPLTFLVFVSFLFLFFPFFNFFFKKEIEKKETKEKEKNFCTKLLLISAATIPPPVC